MRARVALYGLLALVLGLSGCAYEKRIATSTPMPPWAMQTPSDTEDRVVFVGTALGDNILDESNARARAMEDVREQIARSLETSVVTEATRIVEEKGAAHLGKDYDRASYSRMIEQKAQQALAGVRQDAFYWEKWKIKTGAFSGAYTKYKYYVRASMPRELYQKIMTELTHEIADQMQSEA